MIVDWSGRKVFRSSGKRVKNKIVIEAIAMDMWLE